MSRPDSSATSTCHSCWVRPWLRATALTLTRPAVMARRKWVVLVRPTVTWPRSRTAVLAPMLAALSIAVVYTPPCTMPQGVWCSPPSCRCPVTLSAVISSRTRPAACRKVPASSSEPALRLGAVAVLRFAGLASASIAVSSPSLFLARVGPGCQDQARRGGVRVQGPVRSGDLARRRDHPPTRADHLPGGHDVRCPDGERLDEVHLQLKRGVRLPALQ